MATHLLKLILIKKSVRKAQFLMENKFRLKGINRRTTLSLKVITKARDRQERASN